LDQAEADPPGLIELFARGRVNEEAAWLLVALAAVTGAAAIMLMTRPVRSVRRRRRAARPPKPPRFFRRLLGLLRRAGLKVRPDQTPRELADEAARRLALPRPMLDELIELYYRIRWMPQEPSGRQLSRAERAVERLREMLRARGRGA
ncbi:MAG: DUF4129 domain-containing protein, partial [Planctomycetes bacterium]|nr:DUF4129 domain-containing protein [Planctomycetota bacterium]